MAITVAIVEDDERVRDSLQALINGTAGFRCVSAFRNAEGAIKEIPSQEPDVVLMDINLPKMSGIECVAEVKKRAPKIQVLMLTVHEDDYQIFRALQAGANGYLLKRSSSTELLRAIGEVHAGGAPMSSSIARRVIQSFHQKTDEARNLPVLTSREAEILHYLARGYSYKEIAEKLAIRFETVHSHLRNIYEKLHVRSRTDAVNKYLQK